MAWTDEIEGEDYGGDIGGVDPGSMVQGDLLGGGMVPIPSMTGGAGGASGDATSRGGSAGGAMFDNSGWNVTFNSNSSIDSNRSQAAALQGYMPYVLLAAAVLVALKWIKKR